MRILAAGDSESSRRAVVERLAAAVIPAGTQLELVGVVHSPIPMVPDPAFALAAAHEEQLRRLRIELPDALETAAQRIRRVSPAAGVRWKVLEGPPADVILAEADAWEATAIVVGDIERRAVADHLATASSTAELVRTRARVPVEVVVASDST